MTAKQPSFLRCCSLAVFLSAATSVNSFTNPIQLQQLIIPRSHTHLYAADSTRGKNGKTKFGQKTDADVSRFLTDFRTADGKVVDPYKMLQVKRSASSIEIKQSYRRLSRKLHPDMVAQRDVLPGNCANLDDVRDEWEKVKFSYEILSDPKVRKNYDRNSSVAEVLDDPGGAMGRAVVGGAMTGIGMVLGGAWKLGEMASKKAYEAAVTEREKKPDKPTTNESEKSTMGSNFGPAAAKAKGNSFGFGPMGTKQSTTNDVEESEKNIVTPTGIGGVFGGNNGISTRDTKSTTSKQVINGNSQNWANKSSTNKSTKPASTEKATNTPKKGGSTTAINNKKKRNNSENNAINLLTPETTTKTNTTAKKKKALKTGGGKGFSKSR